MILFLVCVMDQELIWGVVRRVVFPGRLFDFWHWVYLRGAGVTGYEKPYRGYLGLYSA